MATIVRQFVGAVRALPILVELRLAQHLQAGHQPEDFWGDATEAVCWGHQGLPMSWPCDEALAAADSIARAQSRLDELTT